MSKSNGVYLRIDQIGNAVANFFSPKQTATYELKESDNTIVCKVGKENVKEKATLTMYRPEVKNLVDELKEANNYRNWLAHGRYWQFKDNPAKYKIEKIRDLAHRIQSTFGSELKIVPKIGEKL